MSRKIGVFDSGVGGLRIAMTIQEALPDDRVMYIEDREHVPYGNKTREEIYGYVLPILQSLEDEGCEVIVIACNTVTTNIIEKLREELNVPLIGMEPMVKPAAAMTKTKMIAVCATPLTLSSERYAWLKQEYAPDITVLEPDCSDWAYMIEHKKIDEQKIKERIESVIERGADVIVLGCTHYHWIEEEIKEIAKDKAEVIQPETAIIERLNQVLAQHA